MSNILSKTRYIFSSFRLQSWIGWVAIFGVGAILFMLPNLFDLVINLFAFSTITASIFVENQYFDRKNDAFNDQKKVLPLVTGKISPRFSLIMILVLLSLGFLPVLLTNLAIIPLYLLYFILWSLYSSPIIHFKSKPIWDVLISGLGSGVFPFIIGVQISNQLSFEYHLPWMQQYYLDTFLSVLPIFFFQIACQIFQEIPDTNADIQTQIETFVIKYGRKKSIKVALISVCISLVLPIVFGLLKLGHTDQFLVYYSIFLLVISPLFMIVLKLWRNSSSNQIRQLTKFSETYSPLIMLVIFLYILLLRIYIT